MAPNTQSTYQTRNRPEILSTLLSNAARIRPEFGPAAILLLNLPESCVPVPRFSFAIVLFAERLSRAFVMTRNGMARDKLQNVVISIQVCRKLVNKTGFVNALLAC